MSPTLFLSGLVVTIALEAGVLWFGLAPRHSAATRLGAAVWLSTVTFPIVNLVLPEWPWLRTPAAVTAVGETFAPIAEVALFFLGQRQAGLDARPTAIRDAVAIIGANLASFGAGLLLFR